MMETPFEYSKYVFGSNFIGRNKELSLFCNLVRERNNILMYAPARTGKKSIIYNSLEKLRQESYDFTVCNINLFNIRCVEAFMLKYTNELFSCFSQSATEWVSFLKKYAPSAPYIIDESANKVKFTYLTKDLLTDSQIIEILRLAEHLSGEYKTHLLIYLEQFHDILLFDDFNRVATLLEKGWRNITNTNFIFTGDRYNAMQEIFYKKNFFKNNVDRIKIVPIAEDVFVNHIVKVFSKAGKTAQTELVTNMYNMVEGDPWYLQHLSSICFDLSKGYLNDKIVDQGMSCLLNLHNFQFNYSIHFLSKHQIRFIKAVLNGVKKFSKADVLDEYKLNSSANVNRIKEALTKKEIIAFNEKKEPYFLDPLLKYWLNKYFFVK